ncbi:MAG: hypothetical protein SA339_08975 [Methanomassiliicoccus sp.]|nr:hypothetical protein [Methanomassiliicoccus sp.]
MTGSKTEEKSPVRGNKSISMVRARTISMVLGGGLLIACGILMLIEDTIDDILWVEVFMGLGLFGGGLFEYLGLRKPLKDERTARIGTLAATYSWYTVLVVVGFLSMVYGMGGGHKISMSQATGAVLITMVISIMAFNWYLGRKGDVE